MTLETTDSKPGERVAGAQLEVLIVTFSLREGRLKLLLRQAGQAQWTLPGRSLVPGASLEDTAIHALQEQTGLREAYLEQLYTYGDPQRGAGRHLISVVYFALIPAGALRPVERWFPVDELPPMTLDHAEIVAYALRRLRYKLEYSAVGFQLLPETFTLSELQRTYELILGEKIDKRNFRRRILDAGVIEATPHFRSGEGRPARLYRYKPDAVAEVKARRLFP